MPCEWMARGIPPGGVITFREPASPRMSMNPHTHRQPGIIGEVRVAGEAAASGKPAMVKGFSTAWLVTPSLIWLLVFLVAPLVSIIVFSFWTYTGSGMAPDLTIKNYVDYFSSPIYLTTLWDTLKYALMVMFFCLLLGYPVAYFLAMQVETFKWQMALFLLCMVPFWINYLIRALAWIPMLGRNGLLNIFLQAIHVIDEPLTIFLFSDFGLVMAMVQLYVVLCVGPIFFSLVKIDRVLLEASRDMGAGHFQIFREIILPLSLPGIATTAILTLVYCWNEFLFALSFTLGPERYTVPVAIALFRGQYQVPWGQILAAAVVATAPVALLMLAFQRRIVQGLTAGAVKG